MANCMASKIHLQLRNKTFYYRVELPRVNNKRRYKIISLHTQNLFNNLIFESDDTGGIFTLVTNFSSKRLSKRNKVKDVAELYSLYCGMSEEIKKLSEENKALMNHIKNLEKEIKEYIGPVNVAIAEICKPKQSVSEPQTPGYTIGQVLDNMMLQKSASNTKTYQTRKRQAIVNLLINAELSLDDDYAKFHEVSMIEKLSKNIINDTSIKNDSKKMRVNYLKELATCGNNINPEVYKNNILNLFPQIDNTKKIDKNPHRPYEKDKLLEMFNPKYDYFQKNPDAFWACMIALFTGARINAAITLQYKDILIKDGIPCIQFCSDHKIKQLKNEASERFVPIHQQLLDLGFVDYINRQKARLKAKDTDFIIKKCQTKSGEYNNKFFTRELSPFFMEIKVKTGNNDGFDFHSFRKNLSIALQDSGVGATYINDIIGWEGKTTMEQSYSNHTLAQIKNEMQKFSYDFLKPHFAKWKTIMAKK